MYNNYRIEKYNSVLKVDNLKQFIISNHYTKAVARGSINYVLYIDNKIKACIQFGIPTGKNCSKYGKNVIELKRMVIDKDCQINTGSWLIAKCIKDIKLTTNYTDVLTYADPEFGHIGTVYKASNFKYLGTQKQSQAIKLGRKKYHLRVAYQKHKGKLTMTAKMLKKLLKTKKAKYIYLKPKHIYLYNIKETK